jgi:hypothetical protein
VRRVLALGQKVDAVRPKGCQPLHQLAVLTWHVLMHKKKVHGPDFPVVCSAGHLKFRAMNCKAVNFSAVVGQSPTLRGIIDDGWCV